MLHLATRNSLRGPYPDRLVLAEFALGCFWGAEKRFWEMPGVWVTAVGYMGGTTPDPTYREICTGATGHAEAVRVVFDPAHTDYPQLLAGFWEGHDPTQGNRQGNDVGSQYRSAIYCHGPEQETLAVRSRDLYQGALEGAGYGPVTTEIGPATEFTFAEDYHQQYLLHNPAGYCGHGGCGIAFPLPELRRAAA